jgi:hypothetical protein
MAVAVVGRGTRIITKKAAMPVDAIAGISVNTINTGAAIITGHAGTIVNIGACRSIARIAIVTSTSEASFGVGASGIGVTGWGGVWTFIDINTSIIFFKKAVFTIPTNHGASGDAAFSVFTAFPIVGKTFIDDAVASH